MAKPAPETSAALVTRMADIERTHNAEDVAGFLGSLNSTPPEITGVGQRWMGFGRSRARPQAARPEGGHPMTLVASVVTARRPA